MEKIKKEIQEIKKVNEKIKKLESKNSGLDEQAVHIWSIDKEAFRKLDEEIKLNKKKIKELQIEKSIYKNNIYYLLKNDFEILFKNEAVEILENEKANKRHFDKISNKIQEFYQNQEIKLKIYITKTSKENYTKLDFSYIFLDDEGFTSYLPFSYNENFYIVLEKYQNNKYYQDGIYTTCRFKIAGYTENAAVEAKKLLKDYTKTLEKIQKLQNEQKILFHNFDDYLVGFLHYIDILNIDTKISIF